jgi:hypothetical protein
MCAELPIQQTIHSETFRTNCRKAILVTRRQSGPSLCERKVNSRAHAGEGLRHVDHQQAFRHRFNHPLRLGLFPKTFLKVAQPAAAADALCATATPTFRIERADTEVSFPVGRYCCQITSSDGRSWIYFDAQSFDA